MKALAAFLLFPALVQAGLLFTLTPAVQSGARGNAVVFTGTVSNTNVTGDVFLNDIQITTSSLLTAQPNAFFANVPGILSPGQTFSDIVFAVGINTNALSGNYTGTVTISGGADIFATNALASQPFQVSSSDTVFEAWRVAQFGADTNNPAISGELADPDGDGIVNLLEYALHLDPHTADTTGLRVGPADPACDCLTLTYRKTIAATDLRYVVEAADEPGGPWSTNAVTEAIIDADLFTMTIRANDTGNSFTNTGKRFMHLRVIRLP